MDKLLTLEQYEAIEAGHQKLAIIRSMKQGGWKADMPLIQVIPTPGIDSLLGKDVLDDINKELAPFLKKINRKILNKVNKAHKTCLADIGAVDGLKEKLLENYPALDPNYVEPKAGEEGPNKEA